MKPRTYQLEVRREGAKWQAQLITLATDETHPQAPQHFDSPLALLEFLERDLPAPHDDNGLN